MTRADATNEVKDQSVQMIEWKHSDGQTDGRTDADCITFPANAVGKDYDKGNSALRMALANEVVDWVHTINGDGYPLSPAD